MLFVVGESDVEDLYSEPEGATSGDLLKVSRSTQEHVEPSLLKQHYINTFMWPHHVTMWLFPYRENNCQELKKETEDKIQTLVADHKAKVRLLQWLQPPQLLIVD